MSDDAFVKLLACGCSGCIWGSNWGCLERTLGRGMVLFTPTPETGGLLRMLMGWNADMWALYHFWFEPAGPPKQRHCAAFAKETVVSFSFNKVIKVLISVLSLVYSVHVSLEVSHAACTMHLFPSLFSLARRQETPTQTTAFLHSFSCKVLSAAKFFQLQSSFSCKVFSAAKCFQLQSSHSR